MTNQAKTSLQKDVAKLRETSSLELRVQISDKISSLYQHGVFVEHERKLAEEVLLLLSKDSEKEIRKILAQNLKDSLVLPKDIALRLAKDIEEVSVPMLEFSAVLKEADLLDVVRSTLQSGSVAAVARRRDLTTEIAHAILDRAYEDAVRDLVGNQHVELAANIVDRVVDEYHASGSIITTLVERGKLPAPVIEKIMATVSNQMKELLIQKYHLDTALAQKIITGTHEEAIALTFSNANNSTQVCDLVDHLSASNKLTPSLVLHALCKGNILFFEMALAKLTGMSYDEVHNICFVLDKAEMEGLYQDAGLPIGAFEAIYLILSFAIKDIASGKFTHTAFANRISERIISGGYDDTVPMMQNMLGLVLSKESPFGME